uniref:PPM-type phosphatase domain-containing protein n=2 Tax=Dunaliella tertiolecta TaxID=3047 RepID=A0A7S3QNI9_DUNTE
MHGLQADQPRGPPSSQHQPPHHGPSAPTPAVPVAPPATLQQHKVPLSQPQPDAQPAPSSTANQASQGPPSKYPQGLPPLGPSLPAKPHPLRWSKLSADHRISSSAAERARLQERGHTVRHRLFGLNISRMLGDRFLKDEDLGFIAEPYISDMQEVAAGGRAFLILASDGLWDVVTEQRAASLVSKAAEEQPSVSAADVADILLSQAITLRSKDDISILVVEVKPLS